MGWNGLRVRKRTTITPEQTDKVFQPHDVHNAPFVCTTVNFIFLPQRFYFVHSYMAVPEADNLEWVAATTNYGPCEFISSVCKGRAMATQVNT